MRIEEQAKKLEHDVKELRELYKNGVIDKAEKDKILSTLTLTYLGCTWMIGFDTGQWYRNEGRGWIPSVSPLQITEEEIKNSIASGIAIDDSSDLKAFLDKLKSKTDE